MIFDVSEHLDSGCMFMERGWEAILFIWFYNIVLS